MQRREGLPECNASRVHVIIFVRVVQLSQVSDLTRGNHSCSRLGQTVPGLFKEGCASGAAYLKHLLARAATPGQ